MDFDKLTNKLQKTLNDRNYLSVGATELFETLKAIRNCTSYKDKIKINLTFY